MQSRKESKIWQRGLTDIRKSLIYTLEYGNKLQETVAFAVVSEVKNNIHIDLLSNKHLLFS